MDPKFRAFFQTEGDVTGLAWENEAFFQIYSRYFANEDYYMSSPASSHALRPIRETIEIADDDLTMSWEQFIEFQTGYPLRIEGAEILSWQLRKAQRMGTYTYEHKTAFNHWGATFNHSMQKNRLMQQGGVIVVVVGHWGNPLTDNEASADGDSFDVNKLTNRDDWLIKTIDDVDSAVGKLSANEASINLFYGGDTYVPDNTGSSVLSITDGDIDVEPLGDDAVESFDAAPVSGGGAAEGTTGLFYVESWLGASFLSGITFI